MAERVVLAYSGGLDTTVAVGWLEEKKGYEVVAAAIDVGQGGDMETIRERALKSGAVDAFVVDARDEFALRYAAPALHANALYQGKYPLVSALSRPLICEHLVQIARSSGATAVAHGCTGKGNDQVRFEVSLGALAPELRVEAPIRDWGMTRDDAIAFGTARGLPIPVGLANPYSVDENMWGRTIECGVLEDPMVEPPDDIWERTIDATSAPREPRFIEVGFEGGVPVSLDGTSLSLAQIVAQLDSAAGAYGFGRIDMIEDRVVGIKSREIYECPGSLALIRAHTDLEELTLDREVLRTKRRLDMRYAELVYEGLWFTPLREAIDAFNASTSSYVSGSVRLRLEPGAVRVVGRSSSNSLYDTALATYDKGDTFDHSAGAGFTKLWGLPAKVWGRTHKR
ncbi:MAG TPA: argininosuccinate synthase [Actinomycetota bacterium]|nr:argininosuccinate synthase [Actinomycetota bacterium]